MKDFVHENGELCQGEVPLQKTQSFDHLQVQRTALDHGFIPFFIGVVISRRVQDCIEGLGHCLVGCPWQQGTSVPHDVWNAGPEEHEPIRRIRFLETGQGFKRSLLWTVIHKKYTCDENVTYLRNMYTQKDTQCENVYNMLTLSVQVKYKYT